MLWLQEKNVGKKQYMWGVRGESLLCQLVDGDVVQVASTKGVSPTLRPETSRKQGYSRKVSKCTSLADVQQNQRHDKTTEAVSSCGASIVLSIPEIQESSQVEKLLAQGETAVLPLRPAKGTATVPSHT